MVAVALLVILGAGFITTFLVSQTSFFSAETYVQVQQEARKAFDNMVRELREGVASSVIVTPSNPGSQLDFQVAIGYDLATQFPGCCNAEQLCAGAYDASGNRQCNWKVRYRLSGTQLIRQVCSASDASCSSPNSTRVLANDVRSGSGATEFSWNAGTRTVALNLVIRYQNPRLPTGIQAIGQLPTGQLSPLKSQVQLRNP